MEHIKIEQNSNVEVVDSNIIHKLAEEAQDCDAFSNMTGNLQTTKAYKKDVDFLLAKFPSLQINATQGLYMSFADKKVEEILATNFGDGTGISEAAAQQITSLSRNSYTHPFREQPIVSFDELKSFNNVKTLVSWEFTRCTALETIDLGNIKKIEANAFSGCASLTNVGDSSKITEIDEYAFEKCTSITYIDTSSVEILKQGAFSNCPLTNFDTSKIKLLEKQNLINYTGRLSLPSLETLGNSAVSNIKYVTHIDSLGVITELPEGNQFAYMDRCVGITLPATLATMNEYNLGNLSGNLRYIKVLATTPPTLPTTGNDISNKQNLKVYVPDASLSAYQSASGWSVFASKIVGLSQFSTDFPND